MLSNVGINNYKAWGIIRDMCKYGDRFESLTIDSNRGITKTSTLDCRSLWIDKNGEHQGYIQDLAVLRNNLSNYNGSTSYQSPYFNMSAALQPYLTNRLFTMTASDDEDVVPFTKYELLHFRLRGTSSEDTYGKSVLDAAIDVWKKVDLMLDSIIIYRLNQAPSRLVFYVDVGNNQGADIENIVMQQINKINKKDSWTLTVV